MTHIAPKEDAEVRRTFGPVAKRQQQILRLSDEAKQQGALLTQKDLAKILDTDVRTIRRDMDQLRQEGFEVPTRGQQNRRILARGSPTGSGPSSSSSRAKNRPKSPGS